MAKLKRARCWRELERPYTRISRYKKKNFIKGAPVCIIAKFEDGNLKPEETKVKVHMVVDRNIQIRQNAIEAIRQQLAKILPEELGVQNYRYIVRAYPHHILRENKLAGTNKAERLQTGMQLAFGTPVGRAYQAHKGDILFTVNLSNEKLVDKVKSIFESLKSKLPCSIEIIVEKVAN